MTRILGVLGLLVLCCTTASLIAVGPRTPASAEQPDRRGQLPGPLRRSSRSGRRSSSSPAASTSPSDRSSGCCRDSVRRADGRGRPSLSRPSRSSFLFGGTRRARQRAAHHPAETPAVPGHAVRHVHLPRGGPTARAEPSAELESVEAHPEFEATAPHRPLRAGREERRRANSSSRPMFIAADRPRRGHRLLPASHRVRPVLVRDRPQRTGREVRRGERESAPGGGVRDLLGARRARRGVAVPRCAIDPVRQRRVSDWELYAILGAVLGGCSLRGGEGTALGMVLGRDGVAGAGEPREFSRCSTAT